MSAPSKSTAITTYLVLNRTQETRLLLRSLTTLVENSENLAIAYDVMDCSHITTAAAHVPSFWIVGLS